MAVVIETTAGDITVDLFLRERPQACLNFIKLCRLKYYNYNLFHTVQEGFIAQTGDPTGKGDGGSSIWGVIEGPSKRYFEGESVPKIRHSEPGLLSMVSGGDNLIGSQFFFTLGADLTSLDGIHCVIGEVTEGHEVLRKMNEAICDGNHRPYKDYRITHTVILEDPYEDPRGFREPSRSPSPTKERLQGGRIAADEDIDDHQGKSEAEINELIADKEAKARATILEIVGDIPDVDAAPPENVLFVCKLNPVTTDDDLVIIFSRFGKINGAEVIRDRVSGDSLQYAFIEFDDKKSCEEAYFKMDNVLIDDRRIHVDFSQSVSKIKWQGKGRWTINENDDDPKNFKYKSEGRNRRDAAEPRRGNYRPERRDHSRDRRNRSNSRDRSRGQPRDRSRDRPRHQPRDRPRDKSRDRFGQRSRDEYRDESRDKPKNRPRDSSTDRSRDKPKKRSRDRSRDRRVEDGKLRRQNDDRSREPRTQSRRSPRSRSRSENRTRVRPERKRQSSSPESRQKEDKKYKRQEEESDSHRRRERSRSKGKSSKHKSHDDCSEDRRSKPEKKKKKHKRRSSSSS